MEVLDSFFVETIIPEYAGLCPQAVEGDGEGGEKKFEGSGKDVYPCWCRKKHRLLCLAPHPHLPSSN